MPTKLASPFLIFITLISIGAGLYFYPALPARIVSHWDMAGRVNGFMDKGPGVGLLPLILLIVLALYFAIPHIDPHKENLWLFRKEYNVFFILIALYLLGIEIMTLLWNTGVHFNMIEIILPMTGILFFYIGVLMHYTKPNWFIGVRTPWTLSSPVVWEKTHALGGTLFKIAGIIACVGILWPQYGVWFILIPALGVSIFLVIYSYVVYQRLVSR